MICQNAISILRLCLRYNMWTLVNIKQCMRFPSAITVIIFDIVLRNQCIFFISFVKIPLIRSTLYNDNNYNSYVFSCAHDNYVIDNWRFYLGIILNLLNLNVHLCISENLYNSYCLEIVFKANWVQILICVNLKITSMHIFIIKMKRFLISAYSNVDYASSTKAL